MSVLSIAPDIVTATSGNLENVGFALRSATTGAATQTTAIAAPAADEVSEAITALFGAHGQEFQALSAKAAAFHDEFVNLLSGGAAQYLNTEIANAQQTLANAVNATSQALLGRPLIATSQSSAAVSLPLLPNIGPFGTPFGIENGFGGITNPQVIGQVLQAQVQLDDMVFPTTTTTKTVPYGNQGSATITNSNTTWGFGFPLSSSTSVTGSDPSGNTIISRSITTPLGLGLGFNVDTANKSLGENISVPFFQQSAQTAPNGNSASVYVADVGGGVQADPQTGAYALSLGTNAPADLGDVGLLAQYNSGSGAWSDTVTGKLPFDLGGASLQATGDGATLTGTGPFGLYQGSVSVPSDGPATWTFNGPGNPNNGVFDTSGYIYDLTGGLNSSLNNVAIDINSLATDNPITQDISNVPANIDSLFATSVSDFTGSLGDPEGLLTQLSNFQLGSNFAVTSDAVSPYGVDGIQQDITGVLTFGAGPFSAQWGSFHGNVAVDQYGGHSVGSETIFGITETAGVYETAGGAPQFFVSGSLFGILNTPQFTF